MTISGGHTQIVRVDDYLKMEVIGETMDVVAFHPDSGFGPTTTNHPMPSRP